MADDSANSVGKRRLNRRSYLRTAAGAAGLAAFGKSAAAAGEEYDVITVPAGKTHRVNLGDGEVLENVLFDISARNARIAVRARANNWVIRNVGVRGRWDGTRNSVHPFVLEVPDPNAEGRVENVHFGTTTASNADHGSGPGGPYVFPGHAGHITFDRVYLQHFQDNGIYASPPGLPGKGKGGTVTIKNCYAYRCGTSNFRLGSTGSKLENCVSIEGHRGFWGQLRETEVVDCDFIDNNADIAAGESGYSTGHNATVTVRRSRWTGAEWTHANGARIVGSSAGSPQRRIPEGCPTSPEEAAAAAGGDGSGGQEKPYVPEGDFTLEFATNDSYAEYLVELKADAVEPSDDADTHGHEYQDRVFELDDRWYVHGHIGSGSHETFDVKGGSIRCIGELEGATRITADRRRIDPAEFDEIDAVPEGGPGLSNVVVFDGRGTSGTTEYEFAVSDAVEPSTDEGATIDEEAVVEDTHAKGVVANYLDAWRFDGEIEQLSIDGDAAVRVNGVEVDPSEFDAVDGDENEDEPNLVNTVVVDGRRATSRTTKYEFAVSDAVEPSTDEGATIDEEAVVDGTCAKGVVANYLDAWRFDGEIEQFSIDGDAAVRVNGVEIDPNEFDEVTR
ncbi:hypothetical protein [Halosolutus gelatinilyticus]|uniref:hypothetical protein n=1 Tax=Halosolutus gelatinilyticus TaxID=2931975 RepID=UPI001FF63447|nr:hypothetical protein [Halosolutus gelatinilyticus]